MTPPPEDVDMQITSCYLAFQLLKFEVFYRPGAQMIGWLPDLNRAVGLYGSGGVVEHQLWTERRHAELAGNT